MSKESERVREEIACMHCVYKGDCDSQPTLDNIPKRLICDINLELAAQTLKIKGIAVLSDDQNPPPSICNSMTISRNIDWAEIYCKAQQDMLKAGFRKVV